MASTSSSTSRGTKLTSLSSNRVDSERNLDSPAEQEGELRCLSNSELYLYNFIYVLSKTISFQAKSMFMASKLVGKYASSTGRGVRAFESYVHGTTPTYIMRMRVFLGHPPLANPI